MRTHGAGIVTHAELFDALAEAGVPREAEVGVRVAGRITYDQACGVVAQRPLPQILAGRYRTPEAVMLQAAIAPAPMG